MPIFEYKCNVCSEEFEKLVLRKEEEITCPKCGKKDIKKKFSVFGMSGVENRGSGCSSCSSSSCSSCH
ncbi:MAG: zinc ribbon domain-containing protein [Thermodesulfovibrionales bacterium]|nr:zinc ribbon domain-containing protein [Thermodesulfovibrionales bacterium]